MPQKACLSIRARTKGHGWHFISTSQVCLRILATRRSLTLLIVTGVLTQTLRNFYFSSHARLVKGCSKIPGKLKTENAAADLAVHRTGTKPQERQWTAYGKVKRVHIPIYIYRYLLDKGTRSCISVSTDIFLIRAWNQLISSSRHNYNPHFY